MLSKLLKYEFKSTGRFLVPLYGLLLAVSLGNKVIGSIGTSSFKAPRSLLAMAYVMLLMGLAMITFIHGITRFKNNLLGDEGYLMFTLPVSRIDLVMSKTIAATVWSIVGMIVAAISMFILAPSDLFMSFIKGLGTFITQNDLNGVIFTVYMLILGVLAVAGVYTPIYLALSLGHMSNKNKMLASFGWYFVINFAWQTLGVLFINIMSHLDRFFDFFMISDFPSTALIHAVFLTLIACALVYNAIHMGITTYILTKKLNLE